MAVNTKVTNSTDTVIEGPLSKWTNVVSGWQYRWFVLDKSTGLLSYYTSRDKMKKGSRRGCIRLKHAVLGIDDEDESTFTISSSSSTFHFQAQSGVERDRWVQALDQTIHKFLKPKVNIPTLKRHQGWSVEDVLAEAEGYHLILQEQVKKVNEVLDSSRIDERIKTETQYLLEHVKTFVGLLKEQKDIEQLAVSLGNTTEEKDFRKSYQSLPSSDTDSVDSAEFHEAELIPEDFESSMIEEVKPPEFVSTISEEDPSDVDEDIDVVEQDDTSRAIAQNKSVIMYMLSQVKIGMDLTKVTLPTFILEKKSLLEMYAEFFAHPDILVSIGDSDDPKERMIEAVRYFMSAFHTARKGTIAKKPYNPVLGETFECWWDLPGQGRKAPTIEDEKIVTSGPCPLAGYNSVSFIAEQVSHHPPVSAFYCECPTKKIYVSAHVYTQSKFLGLSLGVHCIGKLHMYLMDRDEEYTVSFPSAYARSILTTPWVELGGKCVLECKKTGYYTNMEFHCKPFYGGRRHKITADLYHVSSSKPYMQVEGEWNGVMHVKHPNGHKEVFVDTSKMRVIRKKIRKLDRQGEMESKRKWHDVTVALEREDIEAATAAKHAIEEKQRKEARERKEQGKEWKQKYFHFTAENKWLYNNLLTKRLQAISENTH